MKNSQKGFIGIVLLVILGLLVVGGGAYYVGMKHQAGVPRIASPSDGYKYNQDSQLNTSTSANTGTGAVVQTNSTTTTSVSNTIGWKTYTDNTYGYAVDYPADWIVEDNILTTVPSKEFCPPELSEQSAGQIRCKMTSKPDSLAPIFVFIYSNGQAPQTEDANHKVFTPPAYSSSFQFYLANNNYSSVYNKMIGSFNYLFHK